jgi:hypothetical protein
MRHTSRRCQRSNRQLDDSGASAYKLDLTVRTNGATSKRIVKPMMGFKDFRCARIILAGIEVMHMIRKGQMRDDGIAEILLSNSILSSCKQFISYLNWLDGPFLSRHTPLSSPSYFHLSRTGRSPYPDGLRSSGRPAVEGLGTWGLSPKSMPIRICNTRSTVTRWRIWSAGCGVLDADFARSGLFAIHARQTASCWP